MLRNAFVLLATSLLASFALAADHASSTFCLTAPSAGSDNAKPLTTLHKSSTSTEVEVVNVKITYTYTGHAPDHTITEHTKSWSTETIDEYMETYTSTYWDGTRTESLPRPTITIVLPSIPKDLREPYVTHTTKLIHDREAQDDGLVQPTRFDTVVCNTIYYATRTLTLTSVTDIVNSGQPKRTISVLQTHTETTTVFATPPAVVETTTKRRRYLTYTTTFEVVTADMTPVK